MRVKRIAAAIGAVALVVVLVIGLSQAGGGGDQTPESAAPSQAQVAKELQGAPAPLAELHGQANPTRSRCVSRSSRVIRWW
jgi:hypothetical protein